MDLYVDHCRDAGFFGMDRGFALPETMMVKNILLRNLFLYALLVFILGASVDWGKCFVQRGKYLLGIVYNGHFENRRDGRVYEDFLKRHHHDRISFEKNLM